MGMKSLGFEEQLGRAAATQTESFLLILKAVVEKKSEAKRS